MQEMKDFVLWMIQTVPQVLLKPPISAFTGVMLLYFTGWLLSRMLHIYK